MSTRCSLMPNPALRSHFMWFSARFPSRYLRIASGGVWVQMVTDAPLSNVIAVGCWEVSAFSRWRRARGHFQREFGPLCLLGFKQMHPRPLAAPMCLCGGPRSDGTGRPWFRGRVVPNTRARLSNRARKDANISRGREWNHQSRIYTHTLSLLL